MNKDGIPNEEREPLENEQPVTEQEAQDVETEGTGTAETETEAITEVDEVTALQENIKALEIQKSELNDKYLRMFAEFQNYRRRTAKEKIDFMQTAGRDIIQALLPVIDDFDRAKTAAESDDTVEPFSEGVMLVYDKLQSILAQKGVKPMESTGESFDTELHEAITEIPVPGMKGKVIDTVEKGYYLNSKIIRYAKVVVGK